MVTVERDVSAPPSDVQAALLRWRTGEGTTLLVLYGALVAVLFPAFHYIARALPGNVPDSMGLRLLSAGFSLFLIALVIGVPAIRPYAYRLQLLNVGVFFLALMAILVNSGNLNWYLTGTLIGLFGAQYAFLRWQDLVTAYALAFVFEAGYSAQVHVLTKPTNLYALGVVFVASVVCIATGTLRIRNLYAQAFNRIRLEFQTSQLRTQSERIAHLAYSDGLTGLLNRVGLNERIDRTIAIARRHGLRMALLYLDLDGFKEINDLHGHDAGDGALVEAALRVQYMLRNGETIARIGGDEFVVLMPVISSLREPEQLAARIEEAFDAPFYLHSQEETMRLGVSIGMAVYPDDGENRLKLLSHADHAMYEIKRRRAERRRTPQLHD